MTTVPFPKNPTEEIHRIDKLLDLNREMLIDAEAMTESVERSEKIAKVKGRVNNLLDERIGWMGARDKGAKP